MALDVNGYNGVFRSFVNFAETNKNIDKGRTILDATPSRFNSKRDITAVTIDVAKNDSVHKWTRGVAEWKVNERTRNIFRAAVIHMFGGESKIPESVKKAMLLSDYNSGKPLTARRILAVKAAIDADGTARALSEKARIRAENVRLGTFQSAEVKAEALKFGFAKGELPKLARAAHLYAQAAGVDEMTAMKAVAEPNSKANRLMQYGGRFVASAENFARGLRLLDSFKDWLAAVQATKKADGDTFANAKTFTDFNFRSSFTGENFIIPFERFVFEELAVNAGADLAETDPEKLFGIRNNAAMRFFATGRYGNFVAVMASVPPKKRAAIYAVFDKLSLPLPETKEAALAFENMMISEKGVESPNLVIGRILRHLPKIERLMAKGALTEKNIVKTLFPDMPSRKWTRRGLNEFTFGLDDLTADFMDREGMDGEDPDLVSQRILSIMESTCCTFKEAMTAYRTGKRVAPPPYMTAAAFSLEDLDGTTRAGRKGLDGNKSGDLWRAYDYSPADDPTNQAKWYLKDPAKVAFGFTFPDGTSLKANDNVYADNIPTILDKLESFAGKVHPRQQSALMFAVSQAGIGVLKGGLLPHGIFSSEHVCVNFALSRNEDTGAITVKYSSPEGLPLRFSWTATINVNGTMATTPMVVEKPLGNVSRADAKKAVSAAAKDFGVKLGKAELNAAANLYARHASGMYPKNAAYLAHYIAKLPLSAVRPAGRGKKSPLELSTEKVAAFAPEIRAWESFDFNDPRLRPLEGEVARQHNEYIAECFAGKSSVGYDKEDPTIFHTMAEDAGRETYVINGKTYLHGTDVGGLTGPAQQKVVLDAFKEAVPDPKARKALSVLLNQYGPGHFLQVMNHIPVQKAAGGSIDMHALGGADKIVNRDFMTGLNPVFLHDMGKTFGLDVAPDGRTAVVTLTLDTGLEMGDVNKNHFGSALIRERITVDLTPEVPVVTDVRISQELQ